MRIRRTAIVGTLIAASLLVLSASVACGRQDHERITEEVAREWSTSEAEDISEEIAAMANIRYGMTIFVETYENGFPNEPGMEDSSRLISSDKIRTSVDREQLQQSIEWEFGPPIEKEEGRYEVIAKASVSFTLLPPESSSLFRDPTFRKPYSGSVNYELEVDTTKREIISAVMPRMSVRIYKVHREGYLN